MLADGGMRMLGLAVWPLLMAAGCLAGRTYRRVSVSVPQSEIASRICVLVGTAPQCVSPRCRDCTGRTGDGGVVCVRTVAKVL
jgi:hypothetical protein